MIATRNRIVAAVIIFSLMRLLINEARKKRITARQGEAVPAEQPPPAAPSAVVFPEILGAPARMGE